MSILQEHFKRKSIWSIKKGRTAKVYLYGNQIITIETDLADSSINYKFDVVGRKKDGNRDLAPKLWNYIANDPHPSAKEKFSKVEIIDEETNKVLKTLHDVDLIGILEGLKKFVRK